MAKCYKCGANMYAYDQFTFQPAQGRWGATGVDMKSNPALYFMADSTSMM